MSGEQDTVPQNAAQQSSRSKRHVVGTVAEIPPGTRKLVEIEGRTIGIFNVNGEFFAVRNICPHQGGPLCDGAQTGLRQSDHPGEYTYTRRGEILRCPWHGWEFDIRTGQSWWNPEQVRTRAYKVCVEAGPVATSPGESEAHGPAAREPGPYTAETYPVSVEESHVKESHIEESHKEQIVVLELS